MTLSEKEHLKETVGMINKAIANATQLSNRVEKSYSETKSYMVSNRGEIDPSEQFQNELFLADIDKQSHQARSSKERLEKLLDSPYFARIDFAETGHDTTVAYIGRFAFSSENAAVISDWRSPIASLFYEGEQGAASYEAPSGTITGDILLKRQLEVKSGELIYAVDTDSSVRDEVLQHELAKVSDQKMSSIISSIQKEQNEIIRNTDTKTLIIQGVAGSGKTSIALHRVAYLLYQRKDQLSSSSVAILSPNPVFGDYISKVLPELGEEPITQLYLHDIFTSLLGGRIIVEPMRSFVDGDIEWQSRAHHKGSFEFSAAIDAFLKSVNESIFEAQALLLEKRTIEADWLSQRFGSYGNLPFNERLDLIASDIFLDVSSNYFSYGTHSLPTKREIRSKLSRMMKAKDEHALYRKFLRDQKDKKLLHRPAKQTIEWEDAAPLVLFKGAFDGFDSYGRIKHLVIDEMQDMSPVQHAMMTRLFNCEKTILGDFGQMVIKGNSMSLEDLSSFYDDAQVIRLTRSYRSTTDIMELAKKARYIPDLETIDRSGKKPSFVKCENSASIIEYLQQAFDDFFQNNFKTLGVIHKSDEIARRYHEVLSKNNEVHLITQDSTSFLNGISIASTRMAKGLEFDQVIILDADYSHYKNDYERNLLYVAITRAMHALTLVYRNNPPAYLL